MEKTMKNPNIKIKVLYYSQFYNLIEIKINYSALRRIKKYLRWENNLKIYYD